MPCKKKSKKMILPNEIYYSDIIEKNMLYAVLLRSSISAGKIKNIFSPTLPENYFFFTAKNLPLNNTLYIETDEITIFAHDQVNYEGQPIGILVGENESELKNILSHIEVEYESIQTISVTNSITEEQVMDHQCFVRGEVAASFEDAFFQHENTYDLDLFLPHLETIGATVLYKSDNFHVFVPSTLSALIKKNVTSMLGISKNKITVHETLTDMQFASSYVIITLILQVTLASLLTEKSVKLVCSASEHKKYAIKNYPIQIRHRTAINDLHQISAMDIRIVLDAGFANLQIKKILERMLIGATGIYLCDNICIDVYALKSNNHPAQLDTERCDAYLFFALENHMNTIAEKIKTNPVAFRLNNSIMNDSLPDKERYVFDKKNLSALFTHAIEQTTFLRKYMSSKLLANFEMQNEKNDFVELP
ncbi:MAG: molybdopterin cofactor-binding domain-containing protein, partial [Treponemataceae bacterium]